MALGEFLGDGTLGSWADEMDSLPSAPAPKSEEEGLRDRFNRRDDFLSGRSERASGPPREDLPLPTSPPFTAFIGNLTFDLTEKELEEFFGSDNTKSVKIIRDRDDKPKGFGYIEFVDLTALKDALAKTGSDFAGRTIRVSVAEPQKNSSMGGGFDDDSKFDSPWRRDGPLPDREAPRGRMDAGERAERTPSASEHVDQWRSSKTRAPVESDAPPFRRRASGFGGADSPSGAADREDSWSMGSKFKPSNNPEDTTTAPVQRINNARRGPEASVGEDSDWRRSRPGNATASLTGSTPPTPQLARRKLELLPRSENPSASSSPLSSPKLSASTAAQPTRGNPFGTARPVDVTSKERQVSERLEKDRDVTQKDRGSHSLSRTSSRTGVERGAPGTPPPSSTPPAVGSAATAKISTAPNVQATISFANMASRKDGSSDAGKDGTEQ